MEQSNQIVIYQTPDGQTSIDVKLENGTLWLTQQQMATLFGVNSQAITKHLKNVYAEQELEKDSTCSKMEQVRIEGKRTVIRQVEFYTLDAIIAVGYRVKSKVATQFRIWANKVLKEYLVNGYAINNRIAAQKYEELSQLVRLLGRTINKDHDLINGEDSRELVNVVTDYTYALDTLDKYDYQQLTIEHTTIEESFRARKSSNVALSCCKEPLVC